MNYDRIFASFPINGTAQNVITSKRDMYPNKLSQLKDEMSNVQSSIIAAKKIKNFPKDKLRELGMLQHELGLKIRQENEKMSRQEKKQIPYHFIKVCRENMSKFEFDKYMKLAIESLKKELDSQKEEDEQD